MDNKLVSVSIARKDNIIATNNIKWGLITLEHILRIDYKNLIS